MTVPLELLVRGGRGGRGRAAAVSGGRVVLGLGRLHAGVLGNALPCLELPVQALALVLELLVAVLELGQGLLGEQLLERPLFDVLLFRLLELEDKRYCSL